MASASSCAVGVSSVCRPASAVGRLASSDLRKACQRSVSPAGRSTSLTNLSRARRSTLGWLPRTYRTSSRVAPSLLSSSAMPVCGCSGCFARLAQLSSSSDMSRPGSTTAPFGSEAITLRSCAVAGTVPVDPAAITGPAGDLAIRRAASKSISAFRRAVGETRPLSRRCAGQLSVTILRNSTVSCQCSECSSGTRFCRAERPTSSLSMKSMRLARSAAR